RQGHSSRPSSSRSWRQRLPACIPHGGRLRPARRWRCARSDMKKALLATVNSTFIAVSALLGGCDIPDNDAREQVPIASSRLSELLSPEDLNAYPLVLEPREFSFPADHGPHPEYRNEWWYVTGNLDAAGGERFGFELTIFRFALVPPDKD